MTYNDFDEQPHGSTNDDFSGYKPSGGGGGGSNDCRNCGQPGHYSRECTEPRQGGGGGGGGDCRNCGQPGHYSRECTEPRQGGGGGGGGDCRNCGQPGHYSRECPEPRKEGGGGGGGGDCRNCGQPGHYSRECPEPRKEGGGGGGDCRNCGQPGHYSRECPEPPKPIIGENGEEIKRAPIYIPEAMPTEKEELYGNMINTGLNFDRYENIPVKMTGLNPPQAITSFAAAIESEHLLEVIRKSGYTKPTPIQKHALPAVLSGRDLMGCAQTGSGKTAAYLLPIVQKLLSDDDESLYGQEPQKPLCLVVAPTRELSIQIHREAYKMTLGTSLKVNILYGGTSVSHQRAQLSSGTHILIGTPGRLSDFLNRGCYSLERLKFLVLDEADRLIDDGFIPKVRELAAHESMPAEHQTLMFSATFKEAVQQIAAEFLREQYLFLAVGMIGGANSDVKQEIRQVEKKEKRGQLVELLSEIDNPDSRTIIFVETKGTADYLANFLSLTNNMTTSIHGDRFQAQREEALRDFRLGRMRVLVATSVASRGLDIKGVSHVINYDLPKDIDDYVHRVGRTGRVGHPGRATSFYVTETDQIIAADLVKVLKESEQEVPQWLEDEALGKSAYSFADNSDIRPESEWNQDNGGGFESTPADDFGSAPADDFGAASTEELAGGGDDDW